MATLKAATAELHRHAESRPLQRAMARGDVTRGQCAMYLAQLALIHSALERGLKANRSTQPAIARVHRAHQIRAEVLQRDAQALGANLQAVEPMPAAAAVIARIDAAARGEAIALLGMLYVLEGSTNGAKFLARRVGDALGLPRDAPLRSFDPYGDQQAERWSAFKRNMDELELGHGQAEAIVDAAAAMFRAIADLSDEAFANADRVAPQSKVKP